MNNAQMRVKNQTNAGYGTWPVMKQKEGPFKELKEYLLHLGITRFYTDDLCAYERNLDSTEQEVGKKIRKRLNGKT